MPSKTEEYLALAQRTANGLTRYWESWTDYLTTASRLYKYPFADQLMIYAQRPDATACAEFDIWRNRMNRYVRRGSKGIALLDESSGFPRLHYVFDVSDTGVRRNSRDPEVWQLGPDLVQPVSEMLAATYGISGERVSQQLADVAGKLVADYWDNNGGDIRAIVDGSLLMDYDEAGVEMQFKSAAAISVTYTLLERCGFEPAGWFDKDDFQAIYNFSTPDSVYALGAAVSDMSREVLRNIERTVKTTIRRRNAERSQYEYEQQERDLYQIDGISVNRAPLMISSNSSPALKPKNSTFLMFFSLIYAFNLFASSVVSSPIIFTWRSGIISYALTTVSTPFSSVTRPKYKPYVPTCGLPTSDLLAVNVGIFLLLTFSSRSLHFLM